MRRISAWVAMAAVPTMIAGVYGMNFENMPELKWKFGYFVVLGIMAAAALVMCRRSAGPGGCSPASSPQPDRAQVALSQPAPRTTNRTSPRATRYQTNVVMGWCATKVNSHAMLA